MKERSNNNWCCENCGKLIKGMCNNEKGFILCLKCFESVKDLKIMLK